MVTEMGLVTCVVSLMVAIKHIFKCLLCSLLYTPVFKKALDKTNARRPRGRVENLDIFMIFTKTMKKEILSLLYIKKI